MSCQKSIYRVNSVPGLEEWRGEVDCGLPLGVDLERGERHVEALLDDGLHQPVPLAVPPQHAPLRVRHARQLELELEVVGKFGQQVDAKEYYGSDFVLGLINSFLKYQNPEQH